METRRVSECFYRFLANVSGYPLRFVLSGFFQQVSKVQIGVENKTAR